MNTQMGLRRGAVFGLIGLGLAGLMAACGSPSSSAAGSSKTGPVKLVYWAGHSSGALYTAVKAEVKQFNKTHPGIQVTFIAKGASHHGLAAFEAGQAPNVGMVSSYIVPQLAQAGALVPLNSYISGPNGLTAAQIKQDYYPVVWNDMLIGGSKNRYLMPLEKKSLVVLYYNANLFKKAHISSPPRTWAQVGVDAAKITALGPKYHGLAWTPSLRQFLTITAADGGRIFSSQTNRKAYSLDNPAAAATVSMLRGWVKNGYMIMTTGYEYQLDFGTGYVGMLIDASAGYTYDYGSVGGKFVMGGVPAPRGTTGHSAEYINGASLTMFNVGTKAQKTASWTFIKWMSSPSTNTYWNEHTNYLPLGPAGYAMMQSFYAKNPAWAASYSNPAYWWFKPRSRVANFEASKPPMLSILMKGLQGQLSVSQTLKQMDSVGSGYLSGQTRG